MACTLTLAVLDAFIHREGQGTCPPVPVGATPLPPFTSTSLSFKTNIAAIIVGYAFLTFLHLGDIECFWLLSRLVEA